MWTSPSGRNAPRKAESAAVNASAGTASLIIPSSSSSSLHAVLSHPSFCPLSLSPPPPHTLSLPSSPPSSSPPPLSPHPPPPPPLTLTLFLLLPSSPFPSHPPPLSSSFLSSPPLTFSSSSYPPLPSVLTPPPLSSSSLSSPPLTHFLFLLLLPSSPFPSHPPPISYSSLSSPPLHTLVICKASGRTLGSTANILRTSGLNSTGTAPSMVSVMRLICAGVRG